MKSVFQGCIFLAGLLAPLTGRPAPAGLFDRSAMTAVSLHGVTAWLGRPILVTSQISFSTGWMGEDGKTKSAYFHFFPALGRFPGGHLLAAYSLVPDAVDCPVLLSGYQISDDGGATWGRRYPVLDQQPALYLPLAPDSLLALPFNLTERHPGDERDFVGPSYLFRGGGAEMLMKPEGMQVAGWPWPISARYSSQPRENWTTRLSFGGTLLRHRGRLLGTAYTPKQGADPYYAVLMTSDDEGAHWRYFSTVAGPDPKLVGHDHYEGPNEMAIAEVAGGDLMAVFRVGSGARWNLRRAYSHDGGLTWSTPEAIAPYSVYPALVRTAGGTIALSTGRPGVDLWLSPDGRGQSWEKIDIAAYNNRWAPDPTFRIDTFGTGSAAKSQTTSYTAMVEVAPNRLLLMYDRDPVVRAPEQPPRNPRDLSRVFVLPVEIERPGA